MLNLQWYCKVYLTILCHIVESISRMWHRYVLFS